VLSAKQWVLNDNRDEPSRIAQKTCPQFGATDIVTERARGRRTHQGATNRVGADAVLECVGTQNRDQASVPRAGWLGLCRRAARSRPQREELFYSHVHAWWTCAVCRFLPELIDLVWNGRSTPQVFDLTLPARSVGRLPRDGRARAIKTLLRP